MQDQTVINVEKLFCKEKKVSMISLKAQFEASKSL